MQRGGGNGERGARVHALRSRDVIAEGRQRLHRLHPQEAELLDKLLLRPTAAPGVEISRVRVCVV